MQTTTLFQRLLWSCIYLSFLTYAITMVASLWEKFSTHPTVTTLVSSTYPVSQIPFPGVAVCSTNKISKKRARLMALHIANFTKRDPKEIMSLMRYVGQLYDFDFEISSISELLEFQNILDSLQISVTDLAKTIATPCDELLRNCFWRGFEINCTDFFFLRRTHQGYCCVFNYVKASNDATVVIPKYPFTTDAGVENGLYVSVNNYPRDYYYTTISAPGVMLHVFIPTDFPDKPSGGLTEILTQPNSENFIEITPTTMVSVDEVAKYRIEKRECLFDYERDTAFNGIYSQSDCFSECRMKSIDAMCQCIPFMIPLSNNNTVCTLADIPCLTRYADKWHSHFPEGDTSLHLQKEKQDSLRCNQKCYPPCAETVYEAFANSFPIFNQKEKEQNITRIYVYYLNRFSKMYRQDVVYYWFEMLSNFGGIFGIFVGWSIISVIQLFDHYLKTALEKLRNS